ncbi:MAG: DUF6442 family protein [Firmicutes bacterium]|nr:DUF6442 family protein [[Eubacterium] siraeum]MCM1488239.1 DUF6442 family protein [Bacillota bacterium]
MTRKLGSRFRKSVKELYIMDKEEILAKAQAEKKDEMESFINDKSMRWTYLAMVLSAGIFTIVRSLRDLPIMDLTATVCLSVCAGQLYRYIKTREKFSLIMSVIMAVIAVISVIRFFMEY